MPHLRRIRLAFILGFLTIICLDARLQSSSPGEKGQSPALLRSLRQRDIAREMMYRPEGAGVRLGLSAGTRDVSAASLPSDKDDDGMPDSWEKLYGFNPVNSDDSWQDADHDQIVNLFEYQLGSHPRNASTPKIVTVGASASADFSSLAEALNSCPSGSVIRIAKGTYRVNYETHSLKSVMIQGGWSPDFHKRDLKLYPVTLDGADKGEILYFSPDSGGNAVILDGITFIRGNGDFGAVALLAHGTVFMKTSIVNCSILRSGCKGAPYGGVLRMHNWEKSLGDRTLANTIIGGNRASGIQAWISEGARSRWRLIHSAIYGNKEGGWEEGYGIYAQAVAEVTAPQLKVHIYNSIIWGNKLGDVKIIGKTAFSVDHSDLGRVGTQVGATCVSGAGVVNLKPGFVDPAHYNYHLSASSPLINKGLNKGIPLTDFEGDKRVKGAAPDMGPDEF
jgi:hypothetical protein